IGAEADNVGHAVPVNVRERARVGVVAAPTAGVGTEGGKLERGGRKVPRTSGEEDMDADRAEADDVGHVVAVNVCKRARGGAVAARAAGVGTEGGKLERGGHKVPVPSGQRLEDAGRAEGDDVGSGIPVYVCEHARVGIVAAPTPGVDTEGGQLERGGRKVPTSCSQRLEAAGRAGADDVRHP